MVRELAEITTLHGADPVQWRGSIADLVPAWSASARTSGRPCARRSCPPPDSLNAPPAALTPSTDSGGIALGRPAPAGLLERCLNHQTENTRNA